MTSNEMILELAEAFERTCAGLLRVSTIAAELVRRGVAPPLPSDMPDAALLSKVASGELMPELVLWYWGDDGTLAQAALLPRSEQFKLLTVKAALGSVGTAGPGDRPSPLASMQRGAWRRLCRYSDQLGCSPMRLLVLAGIAADELSAVIC